MEEAIGYVRISDDGAGAGLGVKRQEKDLRALAGKLNKRLVRVYVDNDVSAFTGKRREGYEEMLDGIRAGADGHLCVLAWHTDRIHRTTRELDDYIDACEIHNAVTRTCQAGLIDLSTPGGRANARMMATFAQYESDIKRERLKLWSKQHAESGKNPGGLRPYGWSAEDRKKLVPEEVAVIKDIADRILAGESLRSIVADLNARMIPTGTWHPPLAWKAWSSTVVRSMMLRPRLAGWRVHNGAQVARGEWEPALDEKVWQQVVSVLTDPERRSGGMGARVNLLTGLARCGICDQPVTIQYGGLKRPERSRNAYGCRTCGTWRAQPAVDAYVEGAVVAYLEAMKLAPDPDVDPAVEVRCQMLRERIQEENDRYADDDTHTLTEHRRILGRLKQRLAAEQAKLLPPRRSRLVRDLAGANAAVRWPSLPLDRKRSVIAELLEIRIMRAGAGRRVFRPETVQLIRR
jgi:site-specific DNA recombinase